jgi:hypothetical protein
MVVDACSDLSNSNWFPVFTNVLVNGSSHFSDPQTVGSQNRFYRLRSP